MSQFIASTIFLFRYATNPKYGGKLARAKCLSQASSSTHMVPGGKEPEWLTNLMEYSDEDNLRKGICFCCWKVRVSYGTLGTECE